MEVEQKSSSSDAPEPRIDRDIKRELKNYKKIDRNWTYPLPPRNIEERLSRKAGNATEFSRNMLYNMSGFEKSLMERATGDDLSDEVTRKAHMKEILYKLEKYSVLHSKIKKKVAERDRYFKTTFKRNDNINQRRVRLCTCHHCFHNTAVVMLHTQELLHRRQRQHFRRDFKRAWKYGWQRTKCKFLPSNGRRDGA